MDHADPTLIAASLRIIRSGQTPEGAYLASPTFPTYHYSWFRDGAFIADAMDAWGEGDSASAFHDWALRTLTRALDDAGPVDPGAPMAPRQRLHTRYRPDGTPGAEDWPNFQLDGFGTWLWAYARHLRRGPAAPNDDARKVIARLAGYLEATWALPNFDCWEEHPDRVHPATLGAVSAGLAAAAEVLGDARHAGSAAAVRSYLLAHGTRDGSFVKHVGSDAVDASLLGLWLRYDIVPAGHPLARGTHARIRRELQDPDGGVKRYGADTFYGGGSWILLTALLAESHLALGEADEATRLARWIEARATADHALPEQVAEHLLAPDRLREWEGRWGPSASPLLWSHAAYLSLARRLGEAA